MLQLSTAKAHWWILDDDPALTQNSGYVASSGHVAALYQDELYEMLTARAGVARLQAFGVIFACNRVVLYLEPSPSKDQVLSPNTARTHLLVNNAPLPWDDWAAEFRNGLPQQISDLMEEVASGSTASDHRQAIRERLQQIRGLFRITRYRPPPKAKLVVDQKHPNTAAYPPRTPRAKPTA